MGRRLWSLILALRVVFALVALALPLGHPHVWRQMDTLGVTLRYWLRWTVEPSLTWPLLPAVLQSGESSGIMAMEFPLLYVILAPLYAFGPNLGFVLVRGMLLALNFGLWAWNLKIWQGQNFFDTSVSQSFRWMPFIGLGLVFFPKFIPDVTAMLLVLAATGLFYQKNKSRFAPFLLLLGLLLKPTAVIVLALLLIRPIVLRAAFPSLTFSCFLAALYYLKGMQWIEQISGNESLYRVSPQHPLRALQEFFLQPDQFAKLWLEGLIFYAGLPLLAMWFVFKSWREDRLLWLLLLLQVLTIAALDGSHSYQHRYYFMGTLPILCLILHKTWTNSGRAFRFLLATLFLGSFAVHLAYEWRPFLIPTKPDRFLSFQDCSRLQAQLADWPWKQGFVFRSTPRQYPLIGVCFGEREGSAHSPLGLFVAGDILPEGCKIVAKEGSIVAAACASKKF